MGTPTASGSAGLQPPLGELLPATALSRSAEHTARSPWGRSMAARWRRVAAAGRARNRHPGCVEFTVMRPDDAIPSPRRASAVAACAPLALTLLLCATACAALLFARWLVGGTVASPFLAWNLFLAGMPFGFALLSRR